MINYNQKYDAGDYENGLLNVVVEIPFGSTEKIEWNRANMEMEIDRQEPSTFPEPVNYGFIPQTTGGDGDNLDAIVISSDFMQVGSIIECKVIGIMRFVDDGEVDDKIVTIQINESKNSDQAFSANKNNIEHYFNHYKDYLRPGITKVLGWGDADDAKLAIRDSVIAWHNQGQ